MKVTLGQALDDATRAALASGRAEPGLGLFIDTLLGLHNITLDEAEAIAGAALEAEAPAEMSPHALDMAFAAIERGGQGKREMVYPDLAGMPEVLRSAILDAEARKGWTQPGPGIRSLTINRTGAVKTEVLRIDPGIAVPWHTHGGQELTLCLIGEFSDARGTYGPGEFSLADPTIRHQPKAHDRGVVYALAVSEGGLKFEGLLGALQRLTGR